MSIIKKSSLAFIVWFIFLQIFYYFATPRIIIVNKTPYPISFGSLQFIETKEEVSLEDVDAWKHSYRTIESLQSSTATLLRSKRSAKEKKFFGIHFRYAGSRYSDENASDLQGVNFKDEPAFINQKAYCNYQVEVYPDKKTVITPTREGWCTRPMYYHKPSFL